MARKEVTFTIPCYGRDFDGNPVLREPVMADVIVSQSTEHSISLNVKCVYNTGGHGQRCKASHPEVDKISEGVNCPYSADVPYALDRKKIIVRGNMVLGDK